MGWPHSVTIAQAIARNILQNHAELDPKQEIKEGNSKISMACRYGIYIDDLFILGHKKKQILQNYDKAWNAFSKQKLPPKPKKCVLPSNKGVDVLGVEINPHGKIEAAREK